MKRNSILASLLLFFAFSLFAQTEDKVFTVEALVCDSVGTVIKASLTKTALPALPHV